MSSSPRRVFHEVTIPEGASESEPINVGGAAVVGVYVTSPDWPEANIAFAVSMDGETYYLACEQDGSPAIVEGAIAGRAYVAPIAPLLASRFVKLIALDEAAVALAMDVEVTLTVVIAP